MIDIFDVLDEYDIASLLDQHDRYMYKIFKIVRIKEPTPGWVVYYRACSVCAWLNPEACKTVIHGSLAEAIEKECSPRIIERVIEAAGR